MNFIILKRGFVYICLAIFGLFLIISASFWTEWNEFPSNPVFDPSSGARAYYPNISYDPDGFNGHGDSAFYKMWFATHVGGVYGVAYAYSNDGIIWTEYNNSSVLPGLQIGSNHPVVLFDVNGFDGGSFFYKIWYWTGIAGTTVGEIRNAVSTDGINWQNDQPIQQHPTDQSLQLIDGVSGGYFYHLYGPGCVIFAPGASNIGSGTPDDKSDDQPMSYSYVMYYDSSGEGSSPNGSIEQESLAYSTDGIYWIRYGDEPVLLPSGNPLDWDGMYTYRSSVILIDGTYHMWYSGANGDSTIGTYYAHGIGHATSVDGLNWTKDPDNPVFHVSDGVSWRNVRCYTPSVVYDTNHFSGNGEPCLYKMWFTGRVNNPTNYTIGYASICLSIDEPPIAIISLLSDSIQVGEETVLDGSHSYDPDGDEIIEYVWILSQKPPGSLIQISNNNSIQTSLIPDMEGRYSICLMVASRNSQGTIVWSSRECIQILAQGFGYCNCPGINLTVERVEDRMWHEKYLIAKLSWSTTEVSPVCDIERFRIERMEQGIWQVVTEVGPDQFSYDDRDVAEWYDYRVIPLRQNGEECIGIIEF